jgi:hypothetical protein
MAASKMLLLAMSDSQLPRYSLLPRPWYFVTFSQNKQTAENTPDELVLGRSNSDRNTGFGLVMTGSVPLGM